MPKAHYLDEKETIPKLKCFIFAACLIATSRVETELVLASKKPVIGDKQPPFYYT